MCLEQLVARNYFCSNNCMIQNKFIYFYILRQRGLINYEFARNFSSVVSSVVQKKLIICSTVIG